MKTYVWLYIALLFLSGTSCQQYIERDKPNILLILTDDMGWGDVGYNGNSLIHTPNIDQLAKEGVRFERFYVDPVCAPSRAALLTGRYAFRSGAIGVSAGWENMESESLTIAEWLKMEGYATGIFGKWHNGRHYNQHPLRQGFDTFVGFQSGGIGNYFDPVLEYNDQEITTRGYVADILTDSAISFIRAKQKRPFFCYLAFNTPHTPFQVPDAYYNTYKAKGLNNAISSIYGMVENIDDHVGRLLQELEEYNIMENTLIIFLSDNGPIGGQAARYNGAMKGTKGSLYEGGVRVPAWMYWKGKTDIGKTISTPVAHIDIFPSILSLMKPDQKPDIPFDGVDIWPLISGKSDHLDRTILTIKQISPQSIQVNPDKLQYALRNEQYCLIKGQSQTELYDLSNDPDQQVNTADSSSHIIHQLSQSAKGLLTDVFQTNFKKRPCPIGEPQATKHVLFADEAYLAGGVKYFKNFGYNSDWITSWRSEADSIYWEVDVETDGCYRASLLYTCPNGEEGSTIQLIAGESTIQKRLDNAYEPAFLEVPDRVEASGKSSLRKPWKSWEIGQIHINSNTKRLVLKAIDIPKGTVADVRALALERCKHHSP